MKKVLSLLIVLVLVLSMVGCDSKTEENATNDKSAEQTKEEAVDTVEEAVTETTEEVTDETRSIGFVMVGLGNQFFEELKAEFNERFTLLGWEVDVANGEFNPQTQITAMENFIAMEKDVIVLWAVSPEPLNAVVQQAMDAGIKVVGFVQPTENYDACLIADNARIAEGEAKLAAKWVDEHFPDAAPGTVPCAVITRDNVDSTKSQGDVLRNIESYNPKIKLVNAYDNDAESVESGVKTAETLYTMNPEVQLFLTVNSATALGISNYFTAMNSPITDYKDMAVFTINGGNEITEQIALSVDEKSPLRGTVMTGGVALTVDDMVTVVNGVLDGTYSNKYNQYAVNLYVYGDTLEEYLKTGNVTSVTDADF